jgi:hypothetical protein
MPRRWIDVFQLRTRSLLRHDRMDAELERELHLHLEQQVEENIARGMSPAEARRMAVSTFGGVERVREEARNARGVGVVENLARDLRHTLRALVHEPMLLIAATMSIALGAAGNLAVYGLARSLVFSTPDLPHVIVVSHEFWQQELGGDSAVVGRALVLNGEGYTIVA